jgi:hypothetical protein
MARNWAYLLLVAFLPFAIGPAAAQETRSTLLRTAAVPRPLTQPARNHVYWCGQSTMAPGPALPWVQRDGTVDNGHKPHVNGTVAWSNHRLNQITAGSDRTITTNGLPSHPTGQFPVSLQDSPEAFQFERSTAAIQQLLRVYNVPITPQVAAPPSCVPVGAIGIALTGAVFFGALNAELHDAVAVEIFDRCEGHPDRMGQYHYHHGSPCFDQGRPDQHSPLVGIAFDGFAIYGRRDVDGRLVTNDNLDECHGHVGPAVNANGVTVTAYHYHINDEFPYILGCFMGTPTIRPNGR